MTGIAEAVSQRPQAVPERPERMSRVFALGDLNELRTVSPVAACLMPLLEALRWRGSPRSIAEALPQDTSDFSIDDLIRVCGDLGYSCATRRISGRRLVPNMLPCLVLLADGKPLIALRHDREALIVFDGARCRIAGIDRHQVRGTAYLFSRVQRTEGEDASEQQPSGIPGTRRDLRRLLAQVAALCLTNAGVVVALAAALLVAIDGAKNEAGRNAPLLLALGLIGLAILDLALKVLTHRRLAALAAAVEQSVGLSAMRRLLRRHPAEPEPCRGKVGAALSALQPWTRAMFVGPAAQALGALPGSLLSFAVIAIAAGSLAWIPAAAAGIMLALSVLLAPVVVRVAAAWESADAARSAFICETAAGLRTIRGHGGEDVWSQRMEQVLARVSRAGLRLSALRALLDAAGWALMAATLLAIVIGAGERVASGMMSMGTLVAGTVLSWRMLAPLQTILGNLFPLVAAHKGLVRLKTSLSREPAPPSPPSPERPSPLKGAITLRQVSLRCEATGDPVLRGIDVSIAPGERVVITGPSGAGKSSLVKLMAGLSLPQDGAVLIDGEDVRRLDYDVLRASVAYVPPTARVFEGTIAYNLRLSQPTASREAMAEAVAAAGLAEWIATLPAGLETPLYPGVLERAPRDIPQRIGLARAYLRPSALYLFDQADGARDLTAEPTFFNKIDALRRLATVVLVSRDARNLETADRILYLERGRLVLNGTPAQVLTAVNARLELIA